MSRQTDHEAMADAADRLEPQMEARFLRAADRMRASVDLDALTLALAKGDADAAVRAAITDQRLREVMDPISTVITTGLVRGGRLGARQLKRLT
tara:strand:- start:4439 stop:4720 length:282 start_codon:yes stop_codon:yes gene_type:complete